MKVSLLVGKRCALQHEQMLGDGVVQISLLLFFLVVAVAVSVVVDKNKVNSLEFQ